jgi:hypothetical protein
MDVAAALGLVAGFLWLALGVLLWFYGYAAHNHANITTGSYYRADPELDRRGFALQAKVGHVGSVMLKFWPLPVALVIASIVVGVVTR